MSVREVKVNRLLSLADVNMERTMEDKDKLIVELRIQLKGF